MQLGGYRERWGGRDIGGGGGGRLCTCVGGGDVAGLEFGRQVLLRRAVRIAVTLMTLMVGVNDTAGPWAAARVVMPVSNPSRRVIGMPQTPLASVFLNPCSPPQEQRVINSTCHGYHHQAH